MTIVEMLGQSGILSLLGMAVVFGFLFILVITISTVGKTMQRLEAKNESGPQAAAGGAAPASSKDGAEVIAAISAAVSEYRKSN